jgi:adenine-specific DNA-methyltransferase
MRERGPAPGNWGSDSRLYDHYTSSAVRALADDETLQAARGDWERFFVQSHGEVFEGLDEERPRESLFVDILYYDFVVDRLIESVEAQFGLRVRNRSANHNTDALPFDFRSLHSSIVDADSIGLGVDELLEGVELAETGPDLLRGLYESVVSRELRLQLGEYYTPRGVAELAVEELDVTDYESETFLDPGCGSGVFLAACIDAKRAALADELAPERLLDVVTDTVYGLELNPVAVKSAKLCYLLSLAPVLEAADVDRLELPVFLADALQLTRDDRIETGGEPLDLSVDHLVGNPPWITWGNLSESLRDAWRERYAAQLDLVPHRGVETRLGHANDDISVPFVWVCIHRYLAADGDASFVLKRDITKGPAGRLLRTQRVGSRPVAVRHVHDFGGLRPFGDEVGVDAAVYTLAADRDPAFPIAVDSWTDGDSTPAFSTAEAMRETLTRTEAGLVPVDDGDPASSWVDAEAEHRALGECEHDIRHGLKDDAADVYGIDRSQLGTLEPDHVYPYIDSRHVVKYGLFGHDLRLVPVRAANEDNEAELKRACPDTYGYLESNRETLESRSSAWLEKGPFYNVFGLGPYTWSAYKVVWCRLGFKPHFAVVGTVEDEDVGEKPVVPGDHFMFISTDSEHEAHFLCGLLNSAPYQRSLAGIASKGKSSLSKAVVSRLELPAYRETDQSRQLAELSMEAHEIVPEHTDVSKREYNQTPIEALAVVQAEIDDLVEEMLAEGSLFPGLGQRTLGSY